MANLLIFALTIALFITVAMLSVIFIQLGYDKLSKKLKRNIMLPDPYRDPEPNEQFKLYKYQDPVYVARHTPLTNYERIWAKSYLARSKSPEDPTGKIEVAADLCKEDLNYLWFNLGKIETNDLGHIKNANRINEVIKSIFFKEREPSFGDIEFHGSRWFDKDTTVVRIRRGEVLIPEFEIDGKKVWLYQVGYGDYEGQYINFWRLHQVREQIEKYGKDK